MKIHLFKMHVIDQTKKRNICSVLYIARGIAYYMYVLYNG